MTFAEILADVYRRGRYPVAPEPTVIVRLKGFVNETQQELAGDPKLAPLLRGSTTFATVASRAEYGLGPRIGRIVTVRDSTNRWPLIRETLSWYRAAVPNLTAQTGTPTHFVDLGPKSVTTQPAAATGVWAASTSAGDTTQTVSLEAHRTGPYLHQPSATTLTGVTRVQLGTQTDYEEIIDWYLNIVCAGDVTLYDGSGIGANVLSVIPKGQTRSTSAWIGLAPTPSAALTYTADYERLITDLVNDTDVPFWLPFAAHRLLAIGARRKEYEYFGDERIAVAVQDWNTALLQCYAIVHNPPGRIVVPGGQGVRRSDLSGQYPAGTVWD
jgi:hypothetical protein